MREEIYKSSSKGKVRFYSYILLLLALGLFFKSGFLSKYFFENTANHSVYELNVHVYEKANLPIIFSAIAFPFYFFMAYVPYVFARKIHKSKQYPPPNSKIPFSLKIKRGDSAVRQAYGFYICAILIMINWIVIFSGSIYMSLMIKEMVNSIK